jgi:hypothetical protein
MVPGTGQKSRQDIFPRSRGDDVPDADQGQLTKNGESLIITIMTKVRQQLRQRNWVAKNNFNRPVRHRDVTQYQRNAKHKGKDHAYQD